MASGRWFRRDRFLLEESSLAVPLVGKIVMAVKSIETCPYLLAVLRLARTGFAFLLCDLDFQPKGFAGKGRLKSKPVPTVHGWRLRPVGASVVNHFSVHTQICVHLGLTIDQSITRAVPEKQGHLQDNDRLTLLQPPLRIVIQFSENDGECYSVNIAEIGNIH